MPFYSYTSEDGVTIEMHFSMNEKPDEVVQEGVTFVRDIAADWAPRGAELRGSDFPYWSEAMGVWNTAQIPEQKAADRKAGFKTEYDDQGRLLITDKQFRKDYYWHQGVHDRNAYGVASEAGHRDLREFDDGEIGV